jgi:hypothetical protein
MNSDDRRLGFKVGIEEYASLTASKRVSALRWWFLLFLLVGLIAAGWVIWRGVRALFEPAPRHAEAVLSQILPIAFADPPPTATQPSSASPQKTGISADGRGAQRDVNPVKAYVMIGIISLIAFILVSSLLVSFFSKNDKAVERASDLVKTCLGFFIGAATGFFGSGP